MHDQYTHFSKCRYHQNIYSYYESYTTVHRSSATQKCLSVKQMYWTIIIKKGQKIFVHGLAFQTMQLNIISIWLTTDVYRMTKVSSRMTSREYMISTPPINQCSSLGQTWICMSLMTWICNSILSLGYIDFRIERGKIIWGIFEVPLICWVKKVNNEKWKQITCTRYTVNLLYLVCTIF